VIYSRSLHHNCVAVADQPSSPGTPTELLHPMQEAPWVFLVLMAVGEARCWVEAARPQTQLAQEAAVVCP